MGDSAVIPTRSSPTLPAILVIGPLPPPAFGVAKATELMIQSPVLAARMRIVHLDTSDRRGLANMGRFDWGNVSLGLKHLGRLTRMLASERPAVTLLTVSQGRLALLRDGLFVLAARTFGSRVVAYMRGSGYANIRARQGWLAGRVLRSILKASSRVIVLGESLVSMARSVYTGARIAVVPNGCYPAVPADRAGTRDTERPVVLYMGRLSRAKGLEDALQAAVKVIASGPSPEFVFCGEWDSPAYRSEVMRLVEQHSLSTATRFPGPTTGSEKEALLARAWVLLVPSHSEGQPWVILEAMSAGIPVVATDTGAIAETLLDGVCGFVVPVGDAGSLANRILALLHDEALWGRMSRASLQRYQDRFTVERSHDALAQVLIQVADGD